MAKLILEDVGNFNLAGLTTLNNNSEKIEAALEKTLSRDGTTPNQMESDLDMNHNDILNVKKLYTDSLIFDRLELQELHLPIDNDEILVSDNGLIVGESKSQFASAAQGAKADTAIQSIIAGQSASVDATDPINPVVAFTGTGTGDVLAANNGSDFDDLASLRKNISLTTYVTNRTALKALDPTKDTVATTISDGGRNGTFVFTAGDFSSQVSSDALEGLYIKATSIPASSGAWVRQFSGPVNAAWFGAAVDGVTDTSSIIVSAMSFGRPVVIPTGVCRIGSDVTFTGTIVVGRGSSLSVDNGVTLTFGNNSWVDAGLYKIFGGTGDVKGLRISYVDWFTNLVWSSTVANADMQRAFNSVRSQGTIYLQMGDLRVDGTAILIPGAMDIVGFGRESTRYFGTSKTTVLFDTASPGGKTISGFSYYGPDFAYATRANGGTVLNVTGSTLVRIEDVFMKRVWQGISYPGANAKLNTIDIDGALNYGLSLGNGYPDVFASQVHIYATRAYVDVSDISGDFEPGETITGLTSGKSNIFEERSGDTLSVGSAPHNPYTVGETIQGATSGATAVVVRTAEPHASGGLRLAERGEGYVLEAVAVIGGRYGILTQVTDTSPRRRPAFIRFLGLYVDSTREGVQLNYTTDLTFVGGWISSSGGSGCIVTNSRGTSFEGTTFANNAVHGLQIGASSKFTTVQGCKFLNNESDGCLVLANATDFSIIGCQATNIDDLPRTQDNGIVVSTGSSDRYIIANNLVSGNGTAGVVDNGSGSNKSVTANF